MSRQVAALPMPDVEPVLAVTREPVLQWVKPTALLVDESYQRNLSERSIRLIRRIVSSWDWRRYKAIDVDEEVLTSTGWMRHGQLRPGDRVFGPDGRPTIVIGNTPVFEDAVCYRVSFCDGYSVVVSGDHLWTLEMPNRARIKGAAKETRQKRKTVTISTSELRKHVDAVFSAADRRYPRIPVAEAIKLPSVSLPVDPYVLGVWLGDGSTGEARVTVGADDLEGMTTALREAGIAVNVSAQRSYFRLQLGEGRRGDNRSSSLVSALRRLGVYHSKHIPNEYLMAAEHQRFALLQGLMDTDGSCSDGRAIFCSANRSLAASVHWLVMSLGMRARLAQRQALYRGEKRPFWQVAFFANFADPPFRLARKAEAAKSSLSQIFGFRRVTGVEVVAARPVSCIQVDREDGLYLVGRHLVPTHNCPIVVETEDGYEVIDGQHTAIAAASHPGLTTIPVMIVEADRVQDRAAAFIGHNRDRLQITSTQMHHAAVAAGDEDAMTIEQVCQRAGIRILKLPPGNGAFKPCETMAVSAIGALIARTSPLRARQILQILSDALCTPVRADAIKAVTHLMLEAEFKDQFRPEDLSVRIRAMGEDAYREGKIVAVTHKLPAWRGLAIVWFRGVKRVRRAA